MRLSRTLVVGMLSSLVFRRCIEVPEEDCRRLPGLEGSTGILEELRLWGILEELRLLELMVGDEYGIGYNCSSRRWSS